MDYKEIANDDLLTIVKASLIATYNAGYAKGEVCSKRGKSRNISCKRIFDEIDTAATRSVDKRYITIPVDFYEKLKESMTK